MSEFSEYKKNGVTQIMLIVTFNSIESLNPKFQYGTSIMYNFLTGANSAEVGFLWHF